MCVYTCIYSRKMSPKAKVDRNFITEFNSLVGSDYRCFPCHSVAPPVLKLTPAPKTTPAVDTGPTQPPAVHVPTAKTTPTPAQEHAAPMAGTSAVEIAPVPVHTAHAAAGLRKMGSPAVAAPHVPILEG